MHTQGGGEKCVMSGNYVPRDATDKIYDYKFEVLNTLNTVYLGSMFTMKVA